MNNTIHFFGNSIYQTSGELRTSFQCFISMNKQFTQPRSLIPPVLKDISGTTSSLVSAEIRPFKNILDACRNGIVTTSDSLIRKHKKPVTQGAKSIFSLRVTQMLTIELPRKFDHPSFNLFIQGIIEFL